MKKVITTMLVAAMVLSMAVPTSAATITRKKSTGTTASTTKVSGDYSLKMVDKTLQFIRGGKVVSSIETKDGKITLRKSSAGGISVVFTDANGKRRNITLGKQNSVALSGTFVQVSVDKALGSSFEVEMEKGSKVTNFYAKGAAKVTLNGSVTTLNVTSSNANVAANGTVSRAYAVNKKAITGMSSGKINQTTTGTANNGSVTTTGNGSSNTSNTTVNTDTSSGSGTSGGSSGIIINGGGSNGGTNTVAAPKITQQPASVEIEEGKTATLTIKATGTGKVSYQWYDAKTGKAITGATSNTLDVKPTETSSYYCMVTNTVGSKKATIRSITVTVTVKGQVVVVAAPVIKTEPADVTVEVGNPATLKVEVEAVAGLTPKYQWYTTNNDGATPVNTAIKDATDATYTVTPDVAGTTSYYCTIINENKDGVKSEPATSKTASITATAKVDDTDLKAAKAAVEALMNQEYPDMTTLENAIKEAAGTTVKPEIKLTEGEDGKVTGTVTLTKDGVKDPVVINFTATIKAEPTENADLKAAKDAIEALKGPYADVDAAKAAINAAVTNEAITVDDSKVALSEDGKTIAGVVGLSIEVDGKPVTATANFSAPVTQEGEVAKAPTFIDNLDKTTEEIQLNTETPVTFTVKASVDGTTENGVTYTWYKSTVAETSDETARKVIGTGNSYTLTTSDLSNDYYYYFVIATNTVDGVSESTPSNVKMIKVVLPEGSAEAPVLSISGDASYTLANPVTDIAVTVAPMTSPTAKLTYEWYKADSINDVGTKVGTNSATYKPSTAKAGVAYYYVKVTNTDSAVTTGLKSVTTTSKRVKITVTATGTVTAKPVTNKEGTETTAIDVTFSPGLPKDTMDALTIADFEIKGDTAGKHDEECTLALSKHTIPTTPANTIRLYVTGADKATETATLTFKKDIKDTGITISDKDREMSVAIVHAVAPAAAAKVVEIEAVPNLSNMDKVLDTKEIKLTFDKELDSAPSALTFTYGENDASVTIGTIKLDPNDKKVVTAEVTVPTGSTAKETITLTSVDSKPLDKADQKTVDLVRDIEAPEFVSAILGTDKKTIDVQFSEELAGTVANGFKIKDSATGGKDVNIATGGVAFGADQSVVRITLAADAATDLYVVYDDATGDLTDDSVTKNKLAGFTRKVSSTVAVEKLAIKNVTVDASSPKAPVVAVEMNDLVSIEGGTLAGTDLFTVTGKGSGHEYGVALIAESVETPRALAAKAVPAKANVFTITLNEELKPEDKAVGVSVAINTASKDASKVTSTTNPEANMGNAETGAKDPVEVVVPTLTYGDQEVIIEGTVGGSPVELYATPTVENFTATTYGMIAKTGGKVENTVDKFEINTSTGVISAKASAELKAGTTDVTVTATDADGGTVTTDVAIVVSAKSAKTEADKITKDALDKADIKVDLNADDADVKTAVETAAGKLVSNGYTVEFKQIAPATTSTAGKTTVKGTFTVTNADDTANVAEVEIVITVNKGTAGGTLEVVGVPEDITASSDATTVKNGISVTGGEGLDDGDVTVELLVKGNDASSFSENDEVTIKITIAPTADYEVADNAAGITAPTGYSASKDASGKLVLTLETPIKVKA